MQRKLNIDVKKFDNVHYKLGHVEGFSYADGEIVALVHASRRELDVTCETCSLSHCVFSTSLNNCTINGRTLEMKMYHLNPQTSYV